MINTIIFFPFIFRINKISVYSTWGLWASSALYHFFDARISWNISKLLEIIDYRMIGLSINSPFLDKFPFVYDYVLKTIQLEIFLHLFSIYLDRDLNIFLKQLPHIIQSLLLIYMTVNHNRQFHIYLRNFMHLIGASFWILKNKDSDRCLYWGNHETSHLILTMSDYLLIYHILKND